MNHTYTLAGDADDLRRLLGIAQVTEDLTRRSLQRVGVEAGWRVLDCGCGPLGALPVLAELVGADGDVYGVDINVRALEQARANLAALGVHGVDLLAGDLKASDDLSIPHDLDLIYTRCFLMHQSDAAGLLRQLATRLRPGGWIVAHEPLRLPAPMAYPETAALADAWALLCTVIERGGAPLDTVESLPRVAKSTGLEVVHSGAAWALMPPDRGFGLHADTLAAARERAIALGVDGDRVDELVETLRDAARGGRCDWVTTPLYLDLALRR